MAEVKKSNHLSNLINPQTLDVFIRVSVRGMVLFLLKNLCILKRYFHLFTACKQPLQLRWPVAPLFLFLCLSLSLYSKFVDTTINLSLILYKTTRIQKHFSNSVFVFIDSLVVSAAQEGAGHMLSSQNSLTSGIGLHELCVWTGGRMLRHNQIILAFIGYQENVQPFFSVQKTVILRFTIDKTARGIFLVFCGVQKLPWPKKQAYVLTDHSSTEQPG